jgi:hypothetical protein
VKKSNPLIHFLQDTLKTSKPPRLDAAMENPRPLPLHGYHTRNTNIDLPSTVPLSLRHPLVVFAENPFNNGCRTHYKEDNPCPRVGILDTSSWFRPLMSIKCT